VIRPFQLGDLYLLQRLHRLATRFDTVQTLADAPSPFLAALSSVAPLRNGPVDTYVLRQAGHGLVQDGFLQVQRRPNRPEADLLCLAPQLEALNGHPAIWTKLLSYYLHELQHHPVERLYCDASDQPLPVNTLCSVGFQIYSRQTIWRLPTGPEDFSHLVTSPVRPAGEGDHWALIRLYELSTPDAVQQAEGYVPGDPERRPPLLTGDGDHWQTYVATRAGEVTGAVQWRPGRHGFWLRLWCNWLEPDSSWRQELLRHGLSLIRGYGARVPVYLAVADHHGALGAVLGDHDFAPFTDRVSLVKHVMRWLREPVLSALPTVEAVTEMATTSQFSRQPGARVQPFFLPETLRTPARNSVCAQQQAPGHPTIVIRPVSAQGTPLPAAEPAWPGLGSI
jgi:hypothetical protein